MAAALALQASRLDICLPRCCMLYLRYAAIGGLPCHRYLRAAAPLSNLRPTATPPALPAAVRSLMNVPFTIPSSADLEKEFISQAAKQGMVSWRQQAAGCLLVGPSGRTQVCAAP